MLRSVKFIDKCSRVSMKGLPGQKGEDWFWYAQVGEKCVGLLLLIFSLCCLNT